MTTANNVARNGGVPLALIIAGGSAVSLSLGVYGSVHDPTGESLISAFFTATINAKVWLATVAVAFAVFQVGSALKIYGKLGGGSSPRWLGPAHRASGTAAFLVSIPVAYHCLWALGFQSGEGNRILAHSLLGCAFYGAFVAKVLFVRSKDLPGWLLPTAGGAVFTVLVGVWLTSSFWFFTTIEFPGI